MAGGSELRSGALEEFPRMPTRGATGLTGSSLGEHSEVLLHHILNCPPLSIPLRTFKLTRSVMWAIDQIENVGVRWLDSEIRYGRQVQSN